MPATQIKYDIVFSGFGASSCILIHELHKKNELLNKRILIIDPSEKKLMIKRFVFGPNHQTTSLKTIRKS